MKVPPVSVGLPVSREPINYIAEAIRSVQNQSFRDWELIVVSDGAPEATQHFLSELADPRIRVFIYREVVGLGARLNQIADLARGDFLARMDADDIMHPMRLERQIALFRDVPGRDVVASRAVIIDEDHTIRGVSRPMPPTVDASSMLAKTPFVHPTVIARTAWWRAHRYQPRFVRSQDKALWLDSASDSQYWRDDGIALFYRVPKRLDTAKYVKTARCERQVVCQYGPGIVGRLTTYRILAVSHAKQAATSVSSRLGFSHFVISRRYSTITDQQRLESQVALNRALAAVDPEFSDRSEMPESR